MRRSSADPVVPALFPEQSVDLPKQRFCGLTIQLHLEFGNDQHMSYERPMRTAVPRLVLVNGFEKEVRRSTLC
jgi:hypothetical protein